MHFLLVNKNVAVKKIFNITAKKAGIELNIVDSIDKIPLDKDYSCIFVDDDMLKTGDIGDFKTKMITTKFCVILSKDSPLVGGFDSYIRKPFLPTDIYEALKKEKYNDMNGTYDGGDPSDDLDDNGLDDGIDSNINANSDIDLSEFSDSEDEFLSGVKEPETAQDIDFNGNPMGDSNIGNSGDSDVTNSVSGDKSSAGDFEIPTTFDLDSVDLGYLGDSTSGDNLSGNLSASVSDSSVEAQNVDLNLGANSVANSTSSLEVDTPDSSMQTPIQDIAQDFTQNTAQLDLDSVDFGADLGVSSTTQPRSQLRDTGDLDLHSADSTNLGNGDADSTIQTDLQSTPIQQPTQQTDDIDFSQIMALQDEILEEEKAKSKKKSIIGGDIYMPKGEVQGATQTQTPVPNLAQTPQGLTPQMPDIANIVPDTADLAQDIATNNIDLAKQAEPIVNVNIEPQDSPIDLVQPQTDLPSNDFIDLVQDSPMPNVDASTDSIDLVQDTTLQDDLVANSTTDSVQNVQDFSIDLAQDSTIQSPNVVDIAPQNVDLQSDSPNMDLQESMKDAQGAENDFLESLDFLKDPMPNATDSNIIDMSGMGSDSIPPSTLPPDLTQDSLDSMSPPPDLTQSQSTEPPKYEEYSFDNMVNEEFDGLDDLNGISSITSDVPPPPSPKPTTKGTNDILNNLEISPQDNIDADYHADSVGAGTPKTMPLNQSEDALNHIDEHNFNSAFSSGISAEMDSISPNFKAQDFIQDLTLGSDTTLPDFSKSLKQHTTAEQRYNMLGLPINEDGAVKDIQDLSKNELESLDDEAILLLQENSLQNKSALKSSQKTTSNITSTAYNSSQDSSKPKILDKQQIDDITNILEGTQKSSVEVSKGLQKSQKPSVSINNNEFGSLTQEALSEVLGEEILDDEFESSDDFINTTSNMANDSLKNSPTPKATNSNVNQSQIPSIPSQINLGDSSLNVAELLQTFPIDKIRELLSGVQITVNITFPTKKQ